MGWGQGCPTDCEEERVSKSQDLEMDKSRRARAKREERVQSQGEEWIEHGKKRKSLFTNLLP